MINIRRRTLVNPWRRLAL